MPSSSKAAAINVRASETQTAGQEAQSRVVCKKRKFGSEAEVMKITSNEDVAETVAVSQNPSTAEQVRMPDTENPVCSLEQKDSDITSCLGLCCRDCTVLYQAKEEGALAKTATIYGSGKNKRERSFQAAWYELHKWLVLCTTRLKAFCFYCRYSTFHGLNAWSSKAETAFTVDGFSNWKKALERFADHKRCQTFN